MGEWKACVTVRVKPALRMELEEFAAGEQRSMGNLGALLLEWSFRQLKAAGSTERLLKGRRHKVAATELTQSAQRQERKGHREEARRIS